MRQHEIERLLEIYGPDATVAHYRLLALAALAHEARGSSPAQLAWLIDAAFQRARQDLLDATASPESETVH